MRNILLICFLITSTVSVKAQSADSLANSNPLKLGIDIRDEKRVVRDRLPKKRHRVRVWRTGQFDLPDNKCIRNLAARHNFLIKDVRKYDLKSKSRMHMLNQENRRAVKRNPYRIEEFLSRIPECD